MDQLFGQSGKVLVDMWRNSEGLNFTSDELANMKVTTEAIHNITGCFDIRVYAAKDEEALMEQGKIFQAENRLLAGKLVMMRIPLSHCGLVTPYGATELGQHWFR